MGAPWEVIVLIVVLAVNRLAVPSVLDRPVPFWGIQVVNGVLALLVIVFGLPSLPEYWQVAWLIAGLLVFHIVQNVAVRSQTLGAARRAAAERERIKQARIDAAEAGSAPPTGGDTP